MALQITDLVSPKALADLKKLNDELIISQQVFAKVAKDLAINVNVKVEGKEDLANLTKVITTNFNQLNAATERAKEAQKKFSDEVGKEVKTIKEAQQYNKDLRKVRNELNATTEEGRRKLKEYNDQINKNTRFIKENSDAYTKLKMDIGKYFEGFTKGALIMKGIEGAISLAQSAFQKFKDAIKDAYHNITEFEYANSTLQSVLGASGEQMKMLQEQAMLLGRNTKYTAQEVTQLQTELARLGFATDEIHAMSEAVLKFGLVTGGSMADSAALAGAMIRTFGANAEETERYVSAMTIATNKSALSFGKLQTGLPLVAGAANALGWEIEDVLALYGKLADSGMSASIAATALRNILGQLANENGTMQKAMGGNINTLEDFTKGLKKLKDEGISLSDTMNEKLGGRRGGVALYNLIQTNEAIVELRDNITGVTDEFNRSAEIMQGNVKTSVDQLRSAWQDLTLVFLDSKGAMKSIIDWFTQAVRNIGDILRSYEQRLARIKEESMSKAQKAVFSAQGGNKSEAQMITDMINKQTAAIKRKNQELSTEEARTMAIAKVRENYKGTFDSWAKSAETYKKKIEEIEKKKKELTDSQRSPDINDALAATTDAEKGGMAVKTRMAKYDQELLTLQKLYTYATEYSQALKKVFSNAGNANVSTDYTDFNLEDYTGSKTGSKTKVKEETAKTQEEITDIVLAYQRDRIKAQLATTEQGSEEELCLKQDLLATEYAITLNNNEKIKNSAIADIEQSAKLGKITEEEKIKYIEQINNDYIRRNEEAKTKMREDDAVLEVENYAQIFAMRRQMLDEQFTEESARNVRELNQRLSDTSLNEKQRLQIVKDYKVKQKQLETDYNEDVRRMSQDSIQKQIDLLDELLGLEAVDTTLRAKLEKELADLKAKYAKAAADEQIKQAERTAKNEEEKARERRKLLEDYLNQAQDTFAAIADFASQQYDIEIDKLNDEKDKLDEKYDADVERIERLEEQGAISSEEAEARKRAAKDQTEQKQKEISKKQQELAYKQAVWDKAASASQAAISTALGIMKVWAAEGTNASKVVMTALVAAQGAMQLATILATPIPKYAKGTEGHKGGLAVVGDGGRSEFVMIGSQGWVTPATSTLVDLPKGAQVFPDAKSVMMTIPVYNENGKQVKVVNDYKELERKQKTANGLLKVIAANTSGNSNYNQYKQTIW